MKKLLSINIFLILICIVLFYTNNLIKIDEFIYSKIIITKSLTPIFKIITTLSNTVPLCIITGITLITLYKKNLKRETKNLGILFVISALLMVTLKEIFKRPRPDINRLIKITGFSFPSGHSLMSFLFYGYLIILVCKNYKGKYKNIIISLFVSIIVLIGFSRIYLGVHYFSDVIFGYNIGLFVLLINEVIQLKRTETKSSI